MSMSNAVTFLDFYQRRIRPVLMAIDLFLREEEEPFAPDAVAELLGVPAPDAPVSRKAFMYILHTGDSAFCRLVQREAERGAPVLYTPEDIAYIYGIAPAPVLRACEALHMTAATALLLPEVFARIPIEAAFAYHTMMHTKGMTNPD